jgi:murein DD-endopeptidase MepM/ murein hydrolase activator NlpD
MKEGRNKSLLKNFTKRQLFGILLTVFSTFFVVLPAFGLTSRELDEQIAAEERRMTIMERRTAYYEQLIKKAGEKEKGILDQITQYDQRKGKAEQQIKVLELKQNKAERRIKELNNDIKKTDARIVEIKGYLKERFVAIYKYGGMAELDLLLTASTAHEAMATSILLSKIAREDEDMIEELGISREKLDASKKELEEQRVLYASQEKKLQAERQAYKAEIQKRNQLLSKLRKEKSLHEQTAKELQKAQEEVGDTIRRLMRQKQELLAREKEKNKKRPSTNIAYLPSGGQLAWPVRGEISERFGKRVHPVFKTTSMHTGIDIRAPRGTSVHAAGPGEVLYVGWLRGYGQIIIIDHGNDLSTVYAHLSSTSVDEGQGISKGQIIGQVGSTGVSTGPHLHFEVRKNGDARDPMKYLR